MNIQLKQRKDTPLPKVKIGASRQIVIPKKLYDTLGLVTGGYLEVGVYKKRQLLITPKEFVDRHPEIDRRLEQAEEDVRAGRVSGPFKNATELAQYLKSIK